MQLITDQRTADIIDGKVPIYAIEMTELKTMQTVFTRLLKRIKVLIYDRENYERFVQSSKIDSK